MRKILAFVVALVYTWIFQGILWALFSGKEFYLVRHVTRGDILELVFITLVVVFIAKNQWVSRYQHIFLEMTAAMIVGVVMLFIAEFMSHLIVHLLGGYTDSLWSSARFMWIQFRVYSVLLIPVIILGRQIGWFWKDSENSNRLSSSIGGDRL